MLDGITDRLQITGWTSTDKALNAAADDVWTRIKGASRTGAIHRNSFREGDGFGIVQLGPDLRARMFKQNPATMAVRYSTDNPDEADLYGKVWRSGKRWRVNLYYPDRTEKYASRGLGVNGGLPKAAAFLLLQPGDPLLGDDEDGVIPNEDQRLPVYHFPNGEPSQYGRSILRGVIPLQDALNKAIADMLVAMEFHAYPQRWATGVQVERDPVTGQERSPFAAGEGRVWRVGSKDAAFGQFDPADMSGFLDVQDALKIEVARKGVLPPHTIALRSGTNVPSGVALLVAEGRTIKLAKDRQRDWGTEHRAWMAHALSLEMATTVLPEDLDLDWAPAETRDEKALLEGLAMKKDLGVPTEQILLEMGYTQDEVDDFLEAVEAVDEAQRAALSVLQGGRGVTTLGAAQTLNGNLALPAGPVPPAGADTALAGA